MKVEITGVIVGTKLARIVSNILCQFFSHFITFVDFTKYFFVAGILEFNPALE